MSGYLRINSIKGKKVEKYTHEILTFWAYHVIVILYKTYSCYGAEYDKSADKTVKKTHRNVKDAK